MIQRFFHWRYLLLLVACGIVAGTIFYTQYLAQKIEKEERQRVEEWLQAARVIQQSQESVAITLASLITENNEDMPLIATDEKDSIIDYFNIDTIAIRQDSLYLEKKLASLQQENKPIKWVISDNPKLEYNIYYGDTRLLSEVKYYPLVQLLVVALFIALVVSMLNIQNKSTQNQVWAGMAKETAHQMGTPLTSLQGWVELLKDNPDNDEIVTDMEKDIGRLKLVSDRFSKIGSTPKLEETALVPLLDDMVAYIKKRAPGKIQFDVRYINASATAAISPTLFNWVLENLLKNALDAMEGSGKITVQLEEQGNSLCIDVTDTGKGISSANIGKVFNPGFTTKKRGWGLGLSLSKRIMTQFHNGELTVKHSEPGKGTTFRILLRK